MQWKKDFLCVIQTEPCRARPFHYNTRFYTVMGLEEPTGMFPMVFLNIDRYVQSTPSRNAIS